jgi:hypothetical protein
MSLQLYLEAKKPNKGGLHQANMPDEARRYWGIAV